MDASVGVSPVELGYVAIGWDHLGDLSKINNERHAFKKAVRNGDPHAKEGSIPVQAGVLYRFVYEVKEGDYIVYPSKVDRMVNIGQVVGPYSHRPDFSADYPNTRSVKWLAHIPREDFRQAALYEIGSFISLFSVTKNKGEFLSKVGIDAGKPSGAETEVSDDETVAQNVSEQAQETTSDFVIKQLKAGLSSYQFEHFVAHLLECMDYHARVTPQSGDGGVDIVAHRDELGFEPPIIKVQCKQTTTPIGQPDIAQLHGVVETGEHGLFVALGSYSKSALMFERTKPNLRLIGGDQLVELIFENYDKFEPKYRSLLPLKRIFVPAISKL
ncbi:restriction endonuclease [Kordiimonas sp.]|uniref:restriction endonuclease n=1 Tax=Kordiimonas sp. TaxID=1970157 RepID=UPI003A94168C